MNKKKKFDAVEMKRKIQGEIYQETKGMTPEEEREYYRKSVEKGPFGKLWKELRGKQKKQAAGE
jgi:hypothetical protein